MCFHRRTWQRLGRGFTLALLAVLLVGCFNYAVAAVISEAGGGGGAGQPSQDYINGLVEGQLRALGQRLDNIEKLLYFLGTCIAGVLITQWVGLRNQRLDNRAIGGNTSMTYGGKKGDHGGRY